MSKHNRERRLKLHSVGKFTPRTANDVQIILTKRFAANIAANKMLLDRSYDRFQSQTDPALFSFYHGKTIFVVTTARGDGHDFQFAGYVDELNDADFVRSMGEDVRAEILRVLGLTSAPTPFVMALPSNYLDDIRGVTNVTGDGQHRTQAH